MKNFMLQTHLKKKTKKEEKIFQDIDEKIANCLDPRKTKMIVEFNDRESASIKSFAVKEGVK